jgi:hypothetical protein
MVVGNRDIYHWEMCQLEMAKKGVYDGDLLFLTNLPDFGSMVDGAVIHHKDTGWERPWVHVGHEVLDKLNKQYSIIRSFTYS